MDGPIGRHTFSSDLICQQMMPPVPTFPPMLALHSGKINTGTELSVNGRARQVELVSSVPVSIFLDAVYICSVC